FPTRRSSDLREPSSRALSPRCGVAGKENLSSAACPWDPSSREKIRKIRALGGSKLMTELQERIAAALKANPERSNRQIAAELDCDKNNVAVMRRRLEANGGIPRVGV